jgi:hypothetical protein
MKSIIQMLVTEPLLSPIPPTGLLNSNQADKLELDAMEQVLPCASSLGSPKIKSISKDH